MGRNIKCACPGLGILLLLFSSMLAAGDWFSDPDSGCQVYAEHKQPIVTVYWDGDCVNGKASGQGVLRVHIDNIPFSTYEGELREGKAHGYGILISPDNSRYEGEFRENRMHGRGAIISVDGKRLEGIYHEGLPHGVMTISAPGAATTIHCHRASSVILKPPGLSAQF